MPNSQFIYNYKKLLLFSIASVNNGLLYSQFSLLCSQFLLYSQFLLCLQFFLLLNDEHSYLLLSILPVGVKFYDDLLTNKNLIIKENKGKSGVYLFYNKLNSNSYVGSGVDLADRLGDYFSNNYLSRPETQTFLIVKAINKYTLNNFSLTILEYVPERELAVIQEQYWIDLIKPEYNILKFAGSSLGYKHTEESIEKMRNSALGRKHTEEVKSFMSESRKGENNSFFGKKHTQETINLFKATAANREKPPVTGIEVDITDLETNTIISYDSIRSAAKAINSDIKTILRREKSQLEKGINTPYRDRYIIVIKRF
jgi:group I intron endonuclease